MPRLAFNRKDTGAAIRSAGNGPDGRKSSPSCLKPFQYGGIVAERYAGLGDSRNRGHIAS
jgi:hypothetical protein